ncbi:MAG: nuclear transport factor 2 family protein [Burkholderiaceae bacterium]|nr:nuclear transport factor 2 family protein [Burkholderiaceae bacterium]
MSQIERLWLERELQLVLNRYAQLCDGREWQLMEQVFSANASAQYGLRTLPDPAAILAMLCNHLGGCGPTQHLLTNTVVDVEMAEENASAEEALLVSSRTTVRASHRGAGDKVAHTYECMGYYHDHWTHTPQGWRIAHRKMVVGFEFGSRSVLAPP